MSQQADHQGGSTAITVDAVYEDGVFKPNQPVHLAEKARVRVTFTPVMPPPRDPVDEVIGIGQGPGNGDGAEQHDHYVYGTPKK